MDIPLDEQIISIAALVAAGLAVTAMVVYGPLLALAYVVSGLSVFSIARWTFARPIRSRAIAPATTGDAN